MIPPPDTTQTLIAHDKPIISGVYHKHNSLNLKANGKIVKTKRQPTPLQEKMIPLFPRDVENSQPIRVAACGLGSVLIDHKVLEMVRFRWSQAEDTYDDMLFCLDAQRAGFQVWTDTAVKCKHLIRNKQAINQG